MTNTEWNAFLDRLDKRYIGGIYKALRVQYAAFAENYRRYGAFYAENLVSVEYLNSGMQGIILDLHTQAGRLMAANTLRDLRSEHLQLKRGFGYNEEWVRQMQEYFRLHSFHSVSRISETTRKRLIEVLSKAAEEGWGVDKTVRALKNLQEIRGRARTIVRTETVRAANYGTFLGAEKFDFEVEKKWIAVHDNRTRHSHRNVDEEQKRPYEQFSNGLQFPGDPNGPANEIINCRCRMAFVGIRDSAGRLIPKKPTRIPAGLIIGNLIPA